MYEILNLVCKKFLHCDYC